VAGTAVIGRHDGGRQAWVIAAIGLAAFGVLCGMALALGELAAFWISITLVVGIAVLFDFRIGAVLLILAMPFGATTFFPHNLFGVTGLNPLNLLLVATAASYIARHRFEGLFPRPLVWLFVIPILLAGLLGTRHVDEIAPAFEEFLGLLNFTDGFGYYRELVVRPLLLVAAALLLGVAVARSQKPERYLIAIIASVWLIALIELVFIFGSGVSLGLLASPEQRRFFSEIGLHANDLGRFFAAASALLLFVWWETKNPTMRGVLLATLCIAGLALLFTFSRSGYLAFMVAGGLFVLWKFNAKSVALALLAVGAVTAIAPGYVWRRITFGFDADANTVSADRIDHIWGPLLPEVWKSPLWGNGIDSTAWSDAARNGEMLLVLHPHNAYLQAVLDMGFIGLALLLAFYWHVWRGFRALGSNPYISPEMRGFFQGATAVLVCFFITGLTGGSLRPEVNYAILWIAIGMMYGVLARKPAG
jgi:O-antigen ligase